MQFNINKTSINTIINNIYMMLIIMIILTSITHTVSAEQQQKQLVEHHHNNGEHGDTEHAHQTSDSALDAHDDNDKVSISSDMAMLNEIVTTKVGEGIISQKQTLYGDVTLSPEDTSHITARFPGRITAVYVQYGDAVKKGQKLALVESNTSLQTYTITSPLTGLVIAKHANAGEVANEQVLFTITNTKTLWAEIRIFPSQVANIELGQQVRLKTADHQLEGQITQLLPSNESAPYRIARVKFTHTSSYWFPGLMIEAEVSVRSESVPIRLPKQALQQVEGKTVVFVKQGDVYEVKPVVLGIQDDHFASVMDGIAVGDEVVIKNSYLIKAELEKAGAAHSH